MRVHDLADGGVATAQLTVHNVSELGLDLPPAAVSGAPVPIGVTHIEICFFLDKKVAGSVIEIVYNGDCPILPPGPGVTRTEVDVGPLTPGDYEVRLFDVTPFGAGINRAPSLQRRPLRVWDAGGCVPAEDRLCLRGGRFRVSAQWRAFDGSTGFAHGLPLPGNDGSGLLWFFAPDNDELTVKILAACSFNGHWWAFLSSASTVEYAVAVTDTATGATRTYRNPLGKVPELIADTGAFPCH